MNWAGDTLVNTHTLQQGGKEIEKLRSEYRIDRLLQSRGLKRVSLVRWRVGRIAHGVLENLAERLREALQKDQAGRGAQVEIA
ncbi:hypothetical protein B0A55_07255 [Friedmanniomyces simplex]|uniref:Uncharacterized protein n=1 Tax=Friedmanniomyces simplex TaxID=329884 RepID=A0A4U0X598_9PEZI|nr:hypothetical protein B0A55_07255 [Friedmanniomyces simplex]